MKRLLFNRQFVNEAGDDLVSGKIHTIRKNYEYWKKYEGQDIALAYWTGKPYRSKQKVFCVKKLVSVEKIKCWKEILVGRPLLHFFDENFKPIHGKDISKKDGFNEFLDFWKWFKSYDGGILAVLHFTEFRYGR